MFLFLFFVWNFSTFIHHEKNLIYFYFKKNIVFSTVKSNHLRPIFQFNVFYERKLINKFYVSCTKSNRSFNSTETKMFINQRNENKENNERCSLLKTQNLNDQFPVRTCYCILAPKLYSHTSTIAMELSLIPTIAYRLYYVLN